MKIQLRWMLILLGILISARSQAQYDNKLPKITYSRYSGGLFELESLKGKPVMIMYFNPTCEVCAEETEKLKQHLSYFEDKHIIMITPHDTADVKIFVEKYQLLEISYITVLLDPKDSFYKIFNSPGFPSLYLYDEKLNYISSFHGLTEFEEIQSNFDLGLKPVTVQEKKSRKFPGL